jgi:flagellar biosynthesis/type III secretory pathway protein FliH
LFEKCKELMEYSLFVKKVEEYAAEKDTTTEQVVCKAVNYCIEHDIMKEFMIAHREEVANMFTEEFDYDRAIEISKEEAREEGREKGHEEGRIKNVRDMIMAGLTSLKAVRESGLYTEEELSLIAAM